MNPWFARNCIYRPMAWIRREPVFRLLAEYEARQWWSPEQIRSRQDEDLRAMLRFAAGHSPFYRDRIRSAGRAPETLEARDLELFEPLTKTQLVGHANDIFVPRLPGTYSLKTTGGSTGVPVTLRKDAFGLAAEQAASWRAYGWYGVRPGDRQARFWGTPLTGRARLRARAIDLALNRDRFSAFAFTPEQLRGYFERVRLARPTWVYGYVSMLVEFASYCEAHSLPLAEVGVKCVVTTSEALGDADRKLIARAFGAPVYNEYGCGEVGAILYECESGLLHLMAENLFLELVPAPTEEQPEAHRILVTDLHNRATPLIRYDIADRVVPAGLCACGRGLAAFREIFGRAYDFVEAPDGTKYHGEFFLYHVEKARVEGLPFLQAQFVQGPADRIEIRLVPAEGYHDEHGQALARSLARAADGRFRVDVRKVDALPRERSGKIRLILAVASAPADQAQAS